MRDGDFFGEMAVLSGEPRTATVTAVKATELLELSRENLRENLQPASSRGGQDPARLRRAHCPLRLPAQLIRPLPVHLCFRFLARDKRPRGCENESRLLSNRIESNRTSHAGYRRARERASARRAAGDCPCEAERHPVGRGEGDSGERAFRGGRDRVYGVDLVTTSPREGRVRDGARDENRLFVASGRSPLSPSFSPYASERFGFDASMLPSPSLRA